MAVRTGATWQVRLNYAALCQISLTTRYVEMWRQKRSIAIYRLRRDRIHGSRVWRGGSSAGPQGRKRRLVSGSKTCQHSGSSVDKATWRRSSKVGTAQYPRRQVSNCVWLFSCCGFFRYSVSYTVVMLLTFIFIIISSIPSPLTLSFQAQNLPILQILSSVAFLFSWLTPRIPRGLFTNTSEHIRYLIFFSFSVGSVRQIKLSRVGFWAHVKISSRIVSYKANMLSALLCICRQSCLRRQHYVFD